MLIKIFTKLEAKNKSTYEYMIIITLLNKIFKVCDYKLNHCTLHNIPVHHFQLWRLLLWLISTYLLHISHLIVYIITDCLILYQILTGYTILVRYNSRLHQIVSTIIDYIRSEQTGSYQLRVDKIGADYFRYIDRLVWKNHRKRGIAQNIYIFYIQNIS